MKEYEELNFTDDFMFCKVMTNNPDLCHELLELIIGHRIGKFTRLDKQAPIEITADGKGVRFDVYSEDDENTVFDCEIPMSVRAAETSAEGSSLYVYDPKGKAAFAYTALIKEVIKKEAV